MRAPGALKQPGDSARRTYDDAIAVAFEHTNGLWCRVTCPNGTTFASPVSELGDDWKPQGDVTALEDVPTCKAGVTNSFEDAVLLRYLTGKCLTRESDAADLLKQCLDAVAPDGRREAVPQHCIPDKVREAFEELRAELRDAGSRVAMLRDERSRLRGSLATETYNRKAWENTAGQLSDERDQLRAQLDAEQRAAGIVIEQLREKAIEALK